MKMKKIFAVLMIMVLTLASCGGGTAGSGSKSLVIYTNSNSDGRGEWWEARAKDAGFDITIVGAGGADLTNRLISEVKNPTADVVFGLNSMLYEQLKEAEVLEKYTPAWSSEVEAGTSDPEGYYHSLVKQALLLIYNKETISGDLIPKGYEDLWSNEALKGKYEAPTQLTQVTPRIILSSILVRYQDPSGELGISEEGWTVLKEFLQNGVKAVEGEELYSNMANGKVEIGTAVSGTMAAKQEQYKLEVGIVQPKIGTPTIIEQIGLVAGSKKTEEAKAFIDWFGNEENQTAFAQEFNAMPTNINAEKVANKEVKEMFDGIKVQELDWGFISEHIESWMEKVELEFL